jgi:hypothetical protein
MLGNAQHYRAIIACQAENVFKFNHSIKLTLLESVSILLKKAKNLFFLRLFYIFLLLAFHNSFAPNTNFILQTNRDFCDGLLVTTNNKYKDPTQHA